MTAAANVSITPLVAVASFRWRSRSPSTIRWIPFPPHRLIKAVSYPVEHTSRSLAW